jgi:arylsulfatase B
LLFLLSRRVLTAIDILPIDGGPIYLPESAANNNPLRGGKYSEFEGGIRSTAFMSGGFLPSNVIGTKQQGMMAIADWYTTFCSLAGVNPYDTWAAESGLPPVDGLDMWPMLSGVNSTSPRTELPVSNHTYIHGDMKLIIGFGAIEASWEGDYYPNSTSIAHDPYNFSLGCDSGCLFNVSADPTEHDNLAEAMPDVVAAMSARFQYWLSTYYQNHEQGVNSCPSDITGECACWMAMNKYGGFFGPYQEVEPPM